MLSNSERKAMKYATETKVPVPKLSPHPPVLQDEMPGQYPPPCLPSRQAAMLPLCVQSQPTLKVLRPTAQAQQLLPRNGRLGDQHLCSPNQEPCKPRVWPTWTPELPHTEL
mmetsp:Transcript_35864/g.55946  ORF Transcript_35864/g.55946 Transcript_35864/m.55946 type:complete len:111 (+) Transcript_35864:860-1192(+)